MNRYRAGGWQTVIDIPWNDQSFTRSGFLSLLPRLHGLLPLQPRDLGFLQHAPYR
jgi:hypothetical protein